MICIDIVPANQLSDGARTDWLPAPRLGEHTETILNEAGFSKAEIAAMIAGGAAANFVQINNGESDV